MQDDEVARRAADGCNWLMAAPGTKKWRGQAAPHHAQHAGAADAAVVGAGRLAAAALLTDPRAPALRRRQRPQLCASVPRSFVTPGSALPFHTALHL